MRYVKVKRASNIFTGIPENEMAKAPSKYKSRSKKSSQLDRTTIIGVIVLVAVVFGTLVLLLARQTSEATNNIRPGAYSGIPQTTTADGAPVLGGPNAKITIMEFADFSCPHCLEYHSVITQIIDTYVRTGKARLVFQPETFVGGQYSDVAAQAALCAAKQNSFWEMQDALFTVQQTGGAQSFTIEQMRTTAIALGLNGNPIVQCIANAETEPAIQKSAAYGERLGVNGTP